MERYDVTGMSCAACSARVEKAVSAVPGVTSCAVNLLTNSMQVDGSAQEAEIIAAVVAAGYAARKKGSAEPSPRQEDSSQAEVSALKRRLIISLIFLSALFTALGLYHKLARYAGAGTLVPITGFANAVVSPAIDFHAEGLITGTAVKMFTVAGPVIVFGTVASIVYGLFLWAFS